MIRQKMSTIRAIAFKGSLNSVLLKTFNYQKGKSLVIRISQTWYLNAMHGAYLAAMRADLRKG